MREAPTPRVGCCGFPAGLARYARAFPVVEVQQTFYQPPLFGTLQKWRAQVPRRFEFTLKAWQLITHEASSPTYRRLREKLTGRERREAGAFRLNPVTVAAWWRTLQCAWALGSRVILFQSPASFKPTRENKANLRAFFRVVHRHAPPGGADDRFTFVWEPRGEWRAEEIQELCEELDLIHGVDPFQMKPVTRSPGYFRLHGRTGYRYRYTPEDFNELRKMMRSHRPAYVLFNNISMWDDARRFQKHALRR
jgi:uncharacterized protein YecE (DUF72 family)